MPSITFLGGSPDQQRLVTTAHSTALDLVRAAERAARAGAKTFATWFGTSDPTSVANRLAILTTVLDQRATVHDINSATPFEVDEELLFCLKDTAEGKLTVAPSQEQFLPTTDNPALTRRAALSMVHVAAVVEQLTDLAMVSDRQGARFIAQWRPDSAAVSPRNYMYFTDSVTP